MWVAQRCSGLAFQRTELCLVPAAHCWPDSLSAQLFKRFPLLPPFCPFHPHPSLDQGQIIMTDFSHQPQAVEQQPLPWLHEQRHYK